MIASLRNVTRIYRSSPDGPAQTVLEGIDFDLEAGETVSVTGPSGCGKSTLLNILGTLDVPTSGSVTLFGRDPLSATEEELCRLRADHIGFIFQLHHLLPQCTALENVLIPALAGDGRPDDALVTRARGLLERVGLGQHLDKKPALLSGGERQRVAVVRALLRRPGLILADEPTGSLDAAGASSLIDLLLELSAGEGSALVLVTHDPSLAARMSRQYRLHHGKLA